MRKINLRGITESLSEREMKLVKGGLDQPMVDLDNQLGGGDDGGSSCKESACNCFCSTNSNCWGECSKCVPIGNWPGKVCSQN